MKFFIDTAKIDEIKEAQKMGIIDGVTTNPSLLYQAGGNPTDVLKEICRAVDGPVSAEVVSLKAGGMVREAKKLAQIADNIVVKIPTIPEGLKAIKQLASLGIQTNATLVFSPSQALLCAKAGASFISPFVGRLDDISLEGMDLIEQIVIILENYDFPSEVIVASVRTPNHVVEAALMGADIATIPFKVINQLVKHPLTDIGLDKFLQDWKKISKK
jgi:transaldolase